MSLHRTIEPTVQLCQRWCIVSAWRGCFPEPRLSVQIECSMYHGSQSRNRRTLGWLTFNVTYCTHCATYFLRRKQRDKSNLSSPVQPSEAGRRTIKRQVNTHNGLQRAPAGNTCTVEQLIYDIDRTTLTRIMTDSVVIQLALATQKWAEEKYPYETRRQMLCLCINI